MGGDGGSVCEWKMFRLGSSTGQFELKQTGPGRLTDQLRVSERPNENSCEWLFGCSSMTSTVGCCSWCDNKISIFVTVVV